MPTGGGKSLCYQIPAIARQRAGHGVAIVVSPLIALMHDQVGALHEAGVEAAFLNSTLSGEQANAVEKRMLRGEVTLLYAAPERVTTPRFLAQLDSLHERGKLQPVRHRRGALRQPVGPRLPAGVPRADGAARALRRRAAHRAHGHGRRASPARTSSSGCSWKRRASSSAASTGPTSATPSSRRRTPTTQLLRFIEREHEGDAGIVYCQSRKRVEEIAQTLSEQGIDALPYHAGLDADVRQRQPGPLPARGRRS